MRKTIATVLTALAVTACGAVNGGTGSNPSPSPTPTPPPTGYAVVLTEKDRSATLHVGEKLEVVLGTATGFANWSHPRSSDEMVLAPTVDPAATAVRGVTLAAFVARAPGVATLTSAGSPNCSPGVACPMLAILWSATVTVTG